jgi:hypothetical protein
MTLRRISYLIFLLFFPCLIHAGTVRLINNSPYDLRAVIRGSDGSYLGEIVVRAQKESVWTDTYGQYGQYGGANPNLNENYRSQTPYTVLWYCLDGGDYAVCDTVSTGAVVTAQGCAGNRMCKPNKQEQYPRQPEGHYLYQEPNLKDVPTAPPLNQ